MTWRVKRPASGVYDMARIQKFEDAESWIRARELTNNIYALTRKPAFYRDAALREQTRRAAISAMSNIAEGFARRTDKELLNFLGIAHGSVAEVQSQLYVALDQKYIEQREFAAAYELTDHCSRLIQALAKYLRRPTPDSRR